MLVLLNELIPVVLDLVSTKSISLQSAKFRIFMDLDIRIRSICSSYFGGAVWKMEEDKSTELDGLFFFSFCSIEKKILLSELHSSPDEAFYVWNTESTKQKWRFMSEISTNWSTAQKWFTILLRTSCTLLLSYGSDHSESLFSFPTLWIQFFRVLDYSFIEDAISFTFQRKRVIIQWDLAPQQLGSHYPQHWPPISTTNQIWFSLAILKIYKKNKPSRLHGWFDPLWCP